jgi:hypothetical protein
MGKIAPPSRGELCLMFMVVLFWVLRVLAAAAWFLTVLWGYGMSRRRSG